MGFLAPLYILGLLAIGIPIILHLIRRTPQGRQMFSSLMFLTPSPPRLTRRSRLSNILLLILRAAAIVLLALAFARPFFHWGENLDRQPASNRRTLILVDTSASMRRPDLWADARKAVAKVVDEAQPGDEVGLYLFDQQVRPAFTFEQWNQADLAARGTMLRGRLDAASPGWRGTRLGDALAAAADIVSENSGESKEKPSISRQIVLVTDFQQGGHMEALQGHEWPKEISLTIAQLTPRHEGNASLQWMKAGPDEAGDEKLRVQVRNEAGSASDQFTLTWANEKGPSADVEPVKVYVPAGRSQMVKLAWPSAGIDGERPDRIVLAGDECDFDNTLYLAATPPETVRLVYVGDDAASDVNGLRFYLQSALADTPARKMEFVTRKGGEEVQAADLAGARLAVVTGATTDGSIGRLRQFAEAGGDVLWVARDVAGAEKAGQLIGQTLQAKEAGGDFSLIGRVETGDPLFAPFADARFADFTKIHFWHHRTVKWEGANGPRILAWFDGGDPFLIEQAIGKGRVRVMTSSWQPSDSQLALSSKFVPLMDEMVERKDAVLGETQYAVGDTLALPAAAGNSAPRVMIAPDGKQTELGQAATAFAGADQPGIYRLNVDGKETPIAVNVSPDESHTAPVMGPAEQLAQYGVNLGKPQDAKELAAQERRLLTAELENRQKLWRWLIVGVLGLLAVETALAGRLARRALRQAAA